MQLTNVKQMMPSSGSWRGSPGRLLRGRSAASSACGALAREPHCGGRGAFDRAPQRRRPRALVTRCVSGARRRLLGIDVDAHQLDAGIGPTRRSDGRGVPTASATSMVGQYRCPLQRLGERMADVRLPPGAHDDGACSASASEIFPFGPTTPPPKTPVACACQRGGLECVRSARHHWITLPPKLTCPRAARR